MSNVFDRIIVGKVVQDLGTFYERTWSAGQERYSGLLVQRRGRYWYVIKSSYRAYFAPSVNYQRIPLDSAAGLEQQLQQARKTARGLPRVADDAAPVSLAVSIITAVIAAAIIILLRDAGWVLLVALMALFIQLYQYAGFKAHSPADTTTEMLLITAPTATLFFAASMLIWLVVGAVR